MTIFKPSNSEELKMLLKNKNVYLGDIDTSLITNMECIFKDVERNTLRGIEKWNVSNVTNMEYMFWGVTEIEEDISDWDVSNVTTMKGMFSDAESITSTDFSKWKLHHKVNLNYMFSSCKTIDNARLPKVPVSATTRGILSADAEKARFLEKAKRSNVCNKDIFSLTNCDELKSKINKKGFFGNSISEIKQKILSNQNALLISINSNKLACFLTQERIGNAVIREEAFCLAYFEKEKELSWTRYC